MNPVVRGGAISSIAGDRPPTVNVDPAMIGEPDPAILRSPTSAIGRSRKVGVPMKHVPEPTAAPTSRPPASDSSLREDSFIEWLIDIAYPFDMTFDPAPPVDLDRLALRWKARDHWDDVSDEDAINCIREEASND